MKGKKWFLAVVMLSVGITLYAQSPSMIEEVSMIQEVLIRSVEEKIASMQTQVGFDDDQARQLRTVEIDFLLGVNKTEHCWLCCKQKRIKKLRQKREEELQKILLRDQYVKYDALENKRIRKGKLRAD